MGAFSGLSRLLALGQPLLTRRGACANGSRHAPGLARAPSPSPEVTASAVRRGGGRYPYPGAGAGSCADRLHAVGKGMTNVGEMRDHIGVV